MLSPRINTMFDEERDWLERQPGMNPWREGCIALARDLDEMLAAYSEPLCEPAVTSEHQEHPRYATRLWGCLGYHWRQGKDTTPSGTIDRDEVTENLRSGQGYQRGRQLGGDPLRDVVLAVAMRLKENRAAEQFHTDYHEYCRCLAGKYRRSLYDQFGPCWSDFLNFLAGYTEERPPKLDRFEGKCGLRNWLGTVLWNFLRRWKGDGMDGTVPIEEWDGSCLEGLDPEQREHVELLAELVPEALDQLPKEDQLLLRLLYADGLALKQAAAILGKHPGNAGRQRDKALKKLKAALAKVAEERGLEGESGGC
jgi:RNA polymerase sigma factor (sigma-70 family)